MFPAAVATHTHTIRIIPQARRDTTPFYEILQEGIPAVDAEDYTLFFSFSSFCFVFQQIQKKEKGTWTTVPLGTRLNSCVVGLLRG